MTAVYLSLGTNLGDRRENLRQALAGLAPVVRLGRISAVYETAPWGPVQDQPNFYNICAAAETDLAPLALLDFVKKLEERLGREVTNRWGPRLIDIDLLLYGETIMVTERLRLPHAQIADRAFVLVPLAEIAPDLVHPGDGRSVGEMAAVVDASGVRRLLEPLDLQRRGKLFAWGARTFVMGILNMTPDSFSGDGVLKEADALTAAAAQAAEFVRDGADIIDIGGESTRPGSTPVSAAEELERVVPAIRAVRSVLPDVLISVDTYRAAVAEAALAAGADWVNDVWGLRMDGAMGAVVAAAGCPVVLMHNRSQPKDAAQSERLGGRYVGVKYDDLIADVKAELQASVDLALGAGVAAEKIIIDPGVGFGKTVKQNLRLVNELDAFRGMGYPILLGTSRKSFIGYTLNLPPEERMEGTAATVAIGIARGADIVRVHDVRPLVRVVQMTDALVR